jgi:hypothetical protein
MKRRSLLLPGLLVACLAVHAETPMTTLRIEVKNTSDKPVDRASVVVKFVRGRSAKKFGMKEKTTWQVKTNLDGVAKIPPIPQGEILIQVIAKGYQTFGQTFQVEEAEKTIEVKLNPPQQQHSAYQ